MKFNFLAIAVVAVIIFSCNKKQTIEEETQKELLQIPITEVVQIDTFYFKEYVSEIQSVQNVEIRSRVKGYLDKIFFDEGKLVKKGDVLFKINDDEYKAEVSQNLASLRIAEANVRTAELELNRIKLLVEKDVISKSELLIANAKVETANAYVEEAQARLHDAELRLAYTLVRAPFDGIINRIPNKPGSLIDEGTLLTTISDNSNIYAYFNQSETEYLNYLKQLKSAEANNEVSLLMANGEEFPSKGQIETIEGEFDQSTGNIAFRARFKNTNNLLKHGSTGKIRQRKDLKNVLLIPQKATFEIQDQTYVFILQADSTVKTKNFTPKQRLNDFYIVDGGLKKGDKIIYEGIQNIREGQKINAQFYSFQKVLEELTN
jgi:membrane fusion protein, multidrug efflux system